MVQLCCDVEFSMAILYMIWLGKVKISKLATVKLLDQLGAWITCYITKILQLGVLLCKSNTVRRYIIC